VVCPWHGWRDDVRTGENVLDARCRVACYPVRLRGTDVLVERSPGPHARMSRAGR
jgi:nitrite reductase/ring-hydroxylating ferredoxin subunit